jgi:hypothetical protein
MDRMKISDVDALAFSVKLYFVGGVLLFMGLSFFVGRLSDRVDALEAQARVEVNK